MSVDIHAFMHSCLIAQTSWITSWRHTSTTICFLVFFDLVRQSDESIALQQTILMILLSRMLKKNDKSCMYSSVVANKQVCSLMARHKVHVFLISHLGLSLRSSQTYMQDAPYNLQPAA